MAIIKFFSGDSILIVILHPTNSQDYFDSDLADILKAG
jgi:hypothetical protein